MIARGPLICRCHRGLEWGGERGKAGGERAGRPGHVAARWGATCHALPRSRYGSRAGITCGQAEIFPSLAAQETPVRLGVEAGAGLGTQGGVLGMEALAALHGLPSARSKVGIRGAKRWQFRLRRCCGCGVPQREPWTRRQRCLRLQRLCSLEVLEPCCPTAPYILGAPRSAVLCRYDKLRNGPRCSRQAVVSLLTTALSTCQSYNEGWAQLLALFPSPCLSLQGVESLGVHAKSLGRGTMEPVPPVLSPLPHHCYPVRGGDELFTPRQGGCLPPPAWCRRG